MPDAPPPAQTPPSPGKGRVFMTRLGSTLVLWAIIATALALKLDWLLFAMIALLGLLGTWEYFGLQGGGKTNKQYARGALFLSLVWWGALAYVCLPQGAEPPWWLDTVLIAAAVQGAFFLAFASTLEGHQTLQRIFNGIFGVIYTTLLWGFMVKLLFLDEAASGRMLVLLVIMITKFSDMGAYFVGTLIGKHKMIPHISPGKTWQGFGGAVLGAYMAAIIMMLVVPASLAPLTWGHLLILAPILCVLGVAGDLAESVLKRCHQIKDSGHKVPGIGGILDLTDSLLFTAPAAYLYLKAIS